MLAHVRPEILRQYYEATYGLGASNGVLQRPEAVRDASAEEYFALARIDAPFVSDRRLAEQAWKRPDIQARASTFSDVAPNASVGRRAWDATLSGERTLDLATALVGKERVAALALSKVRGERGIINWREFARLKALRALMIHACDSTDVKPLAPPCDLELLDLGDCTERCIAVALGSFRAANVIIIEWKRERIDLTPLIDHRALTEVWIAAHEVTSVAALAGRSLVSMRIGTMARADEIRPVLEAARTTLRDLSVHASTPFGPAELGVLPDRLERLSVSAHPSQRDAWIEWALAHPAVGCSFEPFHREEPLAEATSIEHYRGVEIAVRTKAKRSARYVIEDDLASRVGFAESNGDLEDRIAARARKARKSFERGSEADTFVVTCKSLDVARWIVDEAYDLGSGGATRSKTPRRAKRR